jgi:hypothetical protein
VIVSLEKYGSFTGFNYYPLFKLPNYLIFHMEEVEHVNWKYAFIEVKIDIEKEISDLVEEDIIKFAYSEIEPDDAIKVLLDVRPN